MSLIEQAAKRLEELRRAGAEIKDGPDATPDASAVAPESDALPTPEAAMRGLAPGAAGLVARGTQRTEHRETTPTPESAPGATRAPAPAMAETTAKAPIRPAQLNVNLERLKNRGMVTPDAPRSQIADEFRVIKRPILRNALGRSGAKVKNGNLVMVTSALPGEGKTFTSVNLAISLAMELDTTILLVDGDVAHPDLPNLLGVANSPGLLELLTRDDLDVADALVRTNIENLTILPAGAHHRRATELLASEQMAILLRELSSRYPDRIIVFDSPPLLATTEARVLATHMGQIVVVVAADSTRQQAVNLAMSTIENCDVVMMVLNKADKTDVGTYYGYYGDDPKQS